MSWSGPSQLTSRYVPIPTYLSPRASSTKEGRRGRFISIFLASSIMQFTYVRLKKLNVLSRFTTRCPIVWPRQGSCHPLLHSRKKDKNTFETDGCHTTRVIILPIEMKESLKREIQYVIIVVTYVIVYACSAIGARTRRSPDRTASSASSNVRCMYYSFCFSPVGGEYQHGRKLVKRTGVRAVLVDV